jgi:aminoglycoside 2'-N-acetyltransferase I
LGRRREGDGIARTMVDNNQRHLDITVAPASELNPPTRAAVIDLCNRAYAEELTAIFESFQDGTHVVGAVNGKLVTHAMWVTRRLQIADGPLLRTAYVELVATAPAFRRRGYAKAAMLRLHQEIQDYDIGGLSPFSVAYYARLGWEQWQGPLFVRKKGQRIRTPDEEEVMIFRLPQTPNLDLNAPLSVEWREGEVW